MNGDSSNRTPETQFACGECGKPINTGCYCSDECANADSLPSNERRLSEKAWDLVDKRGRDECWPWIGAAFRGGYGRFQDSTAHRFIWTTLHGPVDPEIEVCHTCDNRICCNPAHLFLGTPKVNALDKKAKGRVARMRGVRNGSCKLTEADIADIRSSPDDSPTLAKRYGVSPSNIRMIRLRETWNHV